MIGNIMDYISSRENKTIKHISKLISSAKYRKQNSQFVCEGLRLCNDAVLSNATIDTFLFSEDAYSKHKEDVDRFISIAKKSYCVDNRIFSSLSDTDTPQGVLFVVKALDKNYDFDKIRKNGVVLALDNVCDPTNLGTILRSAEAFGIDCVVLSMGCCDVYSPKVIRGSMGAVFRTSFFITDDLSKFIEEFNSYGKSYAAILDDKAKKLTDTVFSKPALSVIGNEANGISKAVLDSCTDRVFIPMNGKAESLNASVAASIILWEMSK